MRLDGNLSASQHRLTRLPDTSQPQTGSCHNRRRHQQMPSSRMFLATDHMQPLYPQNHHFNFTLLNPLQSLNLCSFQRSSDQSPQFCYSEESSQVLCKIILKFLPSFQLPHFRLTSTLKAPTQQALSLQPPLWHLTALQFCSQFRSFTSHLHAQNSRQTENFDEALTGSLVKGADFLVCCQVKAIEGIR